MRANVCYYEVVRNWTRGPTTYEIFSADKYRKVLNVTKLQYELRCNLNFIRLFETLMENDISIFSEIVES